MKKKWDFMGYYARVYIDIDSGPGSVSNQHLRFEHMKTWILINKKWGDCWNPINNINGV
jgi:hypothetical protein